MRDIAKLPKWAQDVITRLERNLERANKKINEIYEQEETNTQVEEGFKRLNLPNGSSIVFSIGDQQVRVRIDQGNLNINGSRAFQIQPLASNNVDIWI